MPYYGKRVTAGDSGLGSFGPGYQRGQRFPAMPTHGWAHTWYTWGGKPTGISPNPSLRGAIWTHSQSLVRYSNSVSPGHVMDWGGAGGEISASLTSPVQLWSGAKYILGALVTANQLNHAMDPAPASGPEDMYFLGKINGSGTPSDPFGIVDSSFEGAFDVWVEYDTNVAPNAPTGMLPIGLQTTTALTFVGNFIDGNSGRGDKIKQFHIQVWRYPDGVLMWDTVQSATSAEQAAAQFSEPYGGTALVPGVTYYWYARTSDQFDVWSEFAGPVAFNINGGGAVVNLTTPSLKQEQNTPDPFGAQWTHVSGLATNLWRFRIKQGGTIVRTSIDYSASIANGNSINVADYWSLFSQALSWGIGDYSWSAQARDTGGLWSQWSADRAFSTNTSPSVPSGLSPNGNVVTTRPLLVCYSSDPDDTTATGFSVTCRIKDAAGGLLQTRTMVYNGTLQRWEYQTLAADLASFAAYKWDARATDGTLTTDWSGEASFTYATGPTITVTAPTEAQVLTTNTPTVTFNQDQTQAAYHVVIAKIPSYETVYDSGVVNAAASPGQSVNHNVPGGVLRNNTSYAIFVSSQNNLGVWGFAPQRTASLLYPAPVTPTGFQVAPYSYPGDATPTANLLTWDASIYPSGTFMNWIVSRRDAGTEPDHPSEVILTKLDLTELSYIDDEVASGASHTYSLRQSTLQGTDETESEETTTQASITLDHIVIHLVRDGSIRAPLRYGRPFTLGYEDDIVETQRWGQRAPRAQIGPKDRRVWSGQMDLHDDRLILAADALAGLRAMRRELVCYRDYYGTLIYGYLRLTEGRGDRSAKAKVNISVFETDFVLGT